MSAAAKSNLKVGETPLDAPGTPCRCGREIVAKWEREFPPIRGANTKSRRDGAPQATVEALVYELREYGLPQLQKPNCLRRLGHVSSAQLREVIDRLVRLQPRTPWIAPLSQSRPHPMTRAALFLPFIALLAIASPALAQRNCIVTKLQIAYSARSKGS
jgi:hypothetical protein